MHLNDEQRLIKQRFEAKQRDEARKTAKLDKVAEKKVMRSLIKLPIMGEYLTFLFSVNRRISYMPVDREKKS